MHGRDRARTVSPTAAHGRAARGIAALALVAVVALGACGEDDDDGGGSDGTGVGATTVMTTPEPGSSTAPATGGGTGAAPTTGGGTGSTVVVLQEGDACTVYGASIEAGDVTLYCDGEVWGTEVPPTTAAAGG